jgi:hypothetical protein
VVFGRDGAVLDVDGGRLFVGLRRVGHGVSLGRVV